MKISDFKFFNFLLFLASLTTAPAFAQEPASEPDSFSDPAEVRQQLDEILAQPEFRRLRLKTQTIPGKPPPEFELPEWLKRFFNGFGGGLSGLSAVGAGFQILAYIILIAICVLIVVLLARAIAQYQRRLDEQLTNGRTFEVGDADLPPGDVPVDVYLARAAELAAQGLYREAIGQLIRGAMSYTERCGLIRFRRGLTHRDYLRALRVRAPQQETFRAMVGVYEPICFGRRPALPEHYHSSESGYRTGFVDAGETIPPPVS